MSVMNISEDDQYNVMCIVAGILHMGNITFREQNNYAAISNDECKLIFLNRLHVFKINKIGI